MRKAAVYLRVSTQDQTTANQERELRAVAERMGCEVTIYRDHGVSGAKGPDKRPAFDKLCRGATKRQFDMVMAWSVDRLGRSLQDLVGFLSEIHALGVDCICIKRVSTPRRRPARPCFRLGMFAEFERAMIQGRVRAGIRRANAQSTKTGNPLGRPKTDAATEAAIRSALAKGDKGIVLRRHGDQLEGNGRHSQDCGRLVGEGPYHEFVGRCPDRHRPRRPTDAVAGLVRRRPADKRAPTATSGR
jgi:DNA invertase Pin-like site-specific DNA recombinase